MLDFSFEGVGLQMVRGLIFDFDVSKLYRISRMGRGKVLHRWIFFLGGGVKYYIRKINTGVPPGLGGYIRSWAGWGRAAV